MFTLSSLPTFIPHKYTFYSTVNSDEREENNFLHMSINEKCVS